jgi:hypothetical protein
MEDISFQRNVTSISRNLPSSGNGDTSEPEDKNEHPQHSAESWNCARSFWISGTDVTRQMYSAGSSGRRLTSSTNRSKRGTLLPVVLEKDPAKCGRVRKRRQTNY